MKEIFLGPQFHSNIYSQHEKKNKQNTQKFLLEMRLCCSWNVRYQKGRFICWSPVSHTATTEEVIAYLNRESKLQYLIAWGRHVSEVRGLSHTCFLDCVALGSHKIRAAWQSLGEWHSQKQVYVPHAPLNCKQLMQEHAKYSHAQQCHAVLGGWQ